MLLTSTSVSVTVRCFEVLEVKTLRDSSCILQRCDLAVAAVGGFVHDGHGGVMFLNFQILVHVKVCRLCCSSGCHVPVRGVRTSPCMFCFWNEWSL